MSDAAAQARTDRLVEAFCSVIDAELVAHPELTIIEVLAALERMRFELTETLVETTGARKV